MKTEQIAKETERKAAALERRLRRQDVARRYKEMLTREPTKGRPGRRTGVSPGAHYVPFVPRGKGPAYYAEVRRLRELGEVAR